MWDGNVFQVVRLNCWGTEWSLLMMQEPLHLQKYFSTTRLSPLLCRIQRKTCDVLRGPHGETDFHPLLATPTPGKHRPVKSSQRIWHFISVSQPAFLPNCQIIEIFLSALRGQICSAWKSTVATIALTRPSYNEVLAFLQWDLGSKCSKKMRAGPV